MSAIRIKWFAPLDGIFGPRTEIELDQAITVAELLQRVSAGEPRLEPYLRFGPQDTRPKGLAVLRGATTLTLNDRIEPGDALDILVGIQGG